MLADVKFCETLPNTSAGRKIAGQLIDASTSVAANYRAACRDYTRPIFVAKLASLRTARGQRKRPSVPPNPSGRSNPSGPPNLPNPPDLQSDNNL